MSAKKSKRDLGYSPEHARSLEQAQEMIDAEKEGRCIFCDIDFKRDKPLNKKGEFDPECKDWPLLWVWHDPYPYNNTELHLIIMPKRHIHNEEWLELTNEEWLQILDAWKWAQKFYKIPGGGFFGRFGKRSHNAGTIGHLHFQLQVPDLTGNVKATFCKSQTPEDIARREARLKPPEQPK